MTDLSIVLISKNQDWNIARLVESVLRETEAFPACEIVLVDSASTDSTTEIASCYPITVLKLRSDQRLSAAAGRYVGYQHTTGDLVLFLDGDMELCTGWLNEGLAVMNTKPDVAVVCGRVVDRPITSRSSPVKLADAPGTYGVAVDVPHGGGAAMYRRSVLDAVGPFNPYLYSDEEPALCLRIRHLGFRILRLSRPIALHYSAPAENLATFMAKRRAHIWLGYGQNIRYFFGSALFWPYLRERGWVVAPAVTLCLGLVAAVASLLTRKWRWVALWGQSLIGLTIGMAVRKRSLRRALLVLLRRLIILDGTIRGLLLEPCDPASYPGKYDVIRQ